MLKQLKLTEVSGENEASNCQFPSRYLVRNAWALAVSWYSSLRGESPDICAVYLILNDSKCLDSLSGIFLRTNDLHIRLCFCAALLQPTFHVKIFPSCLCYYQPPLFVYCPNRVLALKEPKLGKG